MQRFGMKVWLTEFSCGDGRDNKPMDKHLAYMSEVFPMLDAADYVYRYAWMSGSSANRGLLVGPPGNQSLTPVRLQRAPRRRRTRKKTAHPNPLTNPRLRWESFSRNYKRVVRCGCCSLCLYPKRVLKMRGGFPSGRSFFGFVFTFEMLQVKEA